MQTIKSVIELPEEIKEYVDINSPENTRLMKEIIVYFTLIKSGKISFGKAAELLRMNKMEYITDLGKIGIPYFDMDEEELM